MGFPPHIEERIMDAHRGRSRRLKIRTILTAFGHQGRGKLVVDRINGLLADRGVVLVPPLNAVGTTLDTTVYFVPAGQETLPAFDVVDEDPELPMEDFLLNEESPSAQPEADETSIEIEAIISEQEDDKVGLSSYEMHTYPADYTLEVLHKKWENKDIRIPPIQRKYVWSLPQASRLIESFLLGLPVPSIFLYEEKATGQLLVVDGQQRMRSVIYFLDERFGEATGGRMPPFRLKLSESSPWNKKSYSELSDDDRRRIRNAVLRAFIMRQLTPEDNTSIQHVFERLNTGGTLLTLQEVRNCVYDGPFNQLMHEMNQLPAWREILGKGAADKRQKDVELILRFLALKFSTYKDPMKDFLGGFMGANKAGARNEDFRKAFTATCAVVYERLGAKPFHIKSGLNVAAFDSVFVAAGNHLDRADENLKPRFQALLADNEYDELTGENTTTLKRVARRLQLADQVLFPEA